MRKREIVGLFIEVATGSTCIQVTVSVPFQEHIKFTPKLIEFKLLGINAVVAIIENDHVVVWQ